MEEKKVNETIEEIEKYMDASLFRLIRELLILDDNYCNQLDICLSNEKKLIEMAPEVRDSWLNYAFHNGCRCYLIKTFPYYWLHLLWQKGKDSFLDYYWKDRLKQYFGKQSWCFDCPSGTSDKNS